MFTASIGCFCAYVYSNILIAPSLLSLLGPLIGTVFPFIQSRLTQSKKQDTKRIESSQPRVTLNSIPFLRRVPGAVKLSSPQSFFVCFMLDK